MLLIKCTEKQMEMIDFSFQTSIAKKNFPITPLQLCCAKSTWQYLLKNVSVEAKNCLPPLPPSIKKRLKNGDYFKFKYLTFKKKKILNIFLCNIKKTSYIFIFNKKMFKNIFLMCNNRRKISNINFWRDINFSRPL